VPSDTEGERLAQVDRATELYKQFNIQTSPDLYIAGVKIICDGVVDGCTAWLSEPYSHTGSSCDPIWTEDMLKSVVQRADSSGLQCAFHAIGDKMIETVIDIIGNVGSRERRHRIEHLELTSARDAARLGAVGILASVQPVHSDPAILEAWPKLVGEHRCKRAFAYKEFVDGGAHLVIGTDAPTAPADALKNLYIATTRRSAKDPESTAKTNAEFAIPLSTAVTAATAGAAYSCFAESQTGQLKVGYKADFAILDAEWSPGALLKAHVSQTWWNGLEVYKCKRT
jgi:predicted amidohydrolase YtcJ